MIDLPEVRQILRDNELIADRAQRLNRRGQLPTKLRHYNKAEDSNQETDDEDLYEQQQANLDKEDGGFGVGGLDLAITGSAIDTSDAPKQIGKQESVIIEEIIAGKKDFDLKNPADIFRLKFNRELTKKQKLAHYLTPDYCIVTRFDTLQVLRLELDSLVSRGGVYYSIFDKVKKPEDFQKEERTSDLMMVVLYFDDSVVDLMAEILNVECRMSKYDCQLPFRCYAADMYDQFNSRQHQAIITQTLQAEIDMEYL